jgi:uncharacterized membrane protein
VPRVRLFFILLALVIYPLAVHGLVVLGAPWIAVVGLVVTSLVSLLAPLLVRGANRDYRWLWVYVLLAALGVLNIATHSVYALFLPPLLVNLGLMSFFASTLRVGRIPFIERLMRLGSRAALGTELRAYARRLTWVWAAYFAAAAALSVLLAWRAPLEAWSLFTNVLNFVFMAALFAAQYFYQRARFGSAGASSPWRILQRLGGLSAHDAAHPLYGGPRK